MGCSGPGKYNSLTTHANGPGIGQGLIEDNDWEPNPATFDVQGAVVFKRFDRNDRGGGSSCDYGGPGTDYTWSVDGNILTLTPAGGSRIATTIAASFSDRTATHGRSYRYEVAARNTAGASPLGGAVTGRRR